MWLVFKVLMEPAGSCRSPGARRSCRTGTEEWERQTLAQLFRPAQTSILRECT